MGFGDHRSAKLSQLFSGNLPAMYYLTSFLTFETVINYRSVRKKNFDEKKIKKTNSEMLISSF